MNQDQVFILHCSISASVRQSVQIAFEDYKLPQDVVETLREANSISIRPNLSQALKKSLDELRLMQRYLYDRCTIHHGDVHFLHADYFDEAKQRIEEIKEHASTSNAKLREAWAEELEKWKQTVDNFFSPLFSDEEQLALVREAYLRIFPTQKEYSNPISVNVVGPYPAVIERCDDPQDVQQIIANEASINTEQVLKAAREGAVDSSLGKIAELLDDLDARPANKVGERVLSDNPKKRGTWQIIAQDISLAAKHNPMLVDMAKLCEDLLKVGELMRDPSSGSVRAAAFQRYTDVRQDIADEAKNLMLKASSSKGLEQLQKSVALTGTYHSLIGDLAGCQTEEELIFLKDKIDTETSIYKHRAKHLSRLLQKVEERMALSDAIADATVSLQEAIDENKSFEVDF